MTDPAEPAAPAWTGFEDLMLPWLEDVARFALSLARHDADADGLAQETFLNA